MNMLPLIGITVGTVEGRYSLPPAYAKAVSLAGGRPVLLCPQSGYPDCLHAILFSGGGDVAPEIAGYPFDASLSDIDRERDRYEIALVQFGIARRLPMLGICRGMQVMNLALGGTLYADLALAGYTEQHALPEGRYHPVSVADDSLLSQLIHPPLVINSHHHQGVNMPAHDLLPVAFSPEGVVEAVESKEKRLLGLQWHPERLSSPSIFQWLCDMAGI